MKVLLATDGSPAAQAAGNLLRRLPWPSTRELTVLSVVDKLDLLLPAQENILEETYNQNAQLQQVLREDAQQLLTQEAECFTAMGWTPQTLLREGHPAHEIVSVAEEMGTDVIVIGSRGMGGVKRFLLGSVSEQVMTYAPCSVIIARQSPDHDTSPEAASTTPLRESDSPLRMLLAYDGSPTAKAMVETIAALPLHERTHILITTVMTVITYFRIDIMETMSDRWKAAKQAAQEELEDIAQRLRKATPHVTVQVHESENTSQEVLDAAQAFDANLIVVGHKGKSGIERLLLGSVANRIVHHAPCSVWVMRG